MRPEFHKHAESNNKMARESESLCTVSLGYFQLLLDHLRQRGVDPAQLYTAYFLSQVERLDPNTRRPVEEWDRMMAVAERHCGDHDLAFELAEFIKPWDTGPIGFITMASRTLQEAAECLAQFYNLLNDVYTLDISLAEQFNLRLIPLGNITSPRLEKLTIATMAWHSRWLSRRADLYFDARFSFAQPPDDQLAVYQKTFGDALVFNAPESCLRGPPAYAGYRVSRGDHGVRDALRLQLTAKMDSLKDTSTSFVHRVERLLKPRLQNGDISLEDVAAEVGVSVRTLQMRLEESGLTFRSLVDRMRHAQVLVYFGQPDLSLIEMAQMLGFATPSSFHHAFRRWTGMAPGEYRKQKLRTPAVAVAIAPTKPTS